MKTETPLRRAVELLKKQNKIKRDNDLCEIFDLKKGTISTYLKGKPGKDFVEEFEKKFDIKLSDFETSEEEGEGVDERIATTTEMAAMFNELMKKLNSIEAKQKNLEANLQSGLMVACQNNSLIQSSLLQDAVRDGRADNSDPGEIFERSLQAAKEILEKTYGYNSTRISNVVKS